MAAPGLCGPRRAPRLLRGGGPALAVAVVGLALGGLGGRSPPTAPLRASAVAVAAVSPPGPPRLTAAAVPAAASRNGPAQQSPLEALRPRRGGLQPPPSFSIRSTPSTAHVPSETTPIPTLVWLLESVGIAALASAPGVHSILLWLGVVLLLLGLWLLAPALQLRCVKAGSQWANSGRSTRSPTPVWCSLATTASPQGPAGPEDSPTTSPPLVDIGPDSDAPLRMPSAEVQRHLDAFAIDVRRVVRCYPTVANYAVERVERITSYLTGLKVHVRRVVEAYPGLLVGKVERYEAVVELLRANGVDVVNTINRYPNVLYRRLDTLRHTMAAIAACGHSVADVVDRQPGLLRCSASDVAVMLQLHRWSATAATQQRPASGQPPPSPAGAPEAADPRVALLASLGLDTDRLLRKAPLVPAHSLDKLQVSVAYLKGLGVNTPRVVWRAPTVLGLLPETLQQRVQFLAENGLDVVRHINGCPTLLLCSVERKLQPTVTFVVEEMKRTTVELDAAYHLWSCSLEDRLRPRFQYLQSLGLSRPTLSSFGSYSDARFASRLAGTDLQHYYAWRLRNGYAVPALPTDADPSGPEEELAHSTSVHPAVSPAPPPI